MLNLNRMEMAEHDVVGCATKRTVFPALLPGYRTWAEALEPRLDDPLTLAPLCVALPERLLRWLAGLREFHLARRAAINPSLIRDPNVWNSSSNEWGDDDEDDWIDDDDGADEEDASEDFLFDDDDDDLDI